MNWYIEFLRGLVAEVDALGMMDKMVGWREEWYSAEKSWVGWEAETSWGHVYTYTLPSVAQIRCVDISGRRAPSPLRGETEEGGGWEGPPSWCAPQHVDKLNRTTRRATICHADMTLNFICGQYAVVACAVIGLCEQPERQRRVERRCGRDKGPCYRAKYPQRYTRGSD